MIYPRGLYEIWLCNSRGHRLALMDGWQALTYSRVNPVSSVGSFSLTLDNRYDRLADIASLIEIWRSPLPWIKPRHEGTYIAEKFNSFSDGKRQIAGDHLNKLLKFRIINEYKDTPRANKSGYAADVMCAYVREQVTALSTDATRDFNQWFPFTVEDGRGWGPEISKDAAHAYLLDTVQGLQKSAAEHDEDPTWLSWAVDNTGHDLDFGVTFRVFKDYRGLNRGLSSRSPLILSQDNALIKIDRERDHGREYTRALVGGAGGSTGRVVQTVRDADRETLAPWWRREAWVDGGEVVVTAELEEKGWRKLRDGKPIDKFKAELRPHPSIAYGINLDLGDLVGVEFQRLWETRVESVTVTTDGSKEDVKMGMEAVWQ